MQYKHMYRAALELEKELLPNPDDSLFCKDIYVIKFTIKIDSAIKIKMMRSGAGYMRFKRKL